MNMYKKNFIKLLIILLFVTFGFITKASSTNGVIDSSYKSALLCLSDDCGLTSVINFKTTLGTPITISSTSITGHAWSETFGWINFNPTNGGVNNNSNGVLSGYAWGENAGWINFKPTLGGVVINSSGEFDGYAWSQNYGWIKFDCSVSNACVKTDWRPGSSGGTTSGSTTSVANITSPNIVDTKVPSESEIKDNPVPTNNNIEEPTTPPSNTEPSNPPSVKTTDSIKKNGTSAGVLGVSSILGSIKDLLSSSFKTVKEITENLADNVVSIVESPAGDITSKTVATTGAVLGAYISVTTVLFSSPITFGEIFFIPIRLWGLLMVAFGIKKRNAPWGTVYDSVTKQPLDPAYVILQDLEGKEVATSITDLDGRYGFLVPPGQYRLVASKTNYEFPSKKLSDQNSDVLYNDLYFSEIIDLKEGEVITKNIPMDPIKFDWNEFAKNQQKLTRFFSRKELVIARISNTLFYFGIIISITATIVSPVLYNFLILALYVVLILLRRTILKPRPYGKVKNRESDSFLPFAILRIFYVNNPSEVMHKVTDKTGKYYCLLPNGDYQVKIENKNSDESYTSVYTSDPISVDRGYINKKFEI